VYLRHEGVLEGQVVPSVDQQLVLQVLGGVEVLAGRLLAVAPSLYTVVAGGDTAVIDLHVGGRMSEFALVVASGALVALKLAANFQL